jgi:hypothetical protein
MQMREPYLPRKAQRRHPISILNSEVIVCDNPMRFSERIFIRMSTNGITIQQQKVSQKLKKPYKLLFIFNNNELD